MIRTWLLICVLHFPRCDKHEHAHSTLCEGKVLWLPAQEWVKHTCSHGSTVAYLLGPALSQSQVYKHTHTHVHTHSDATNLMPSHQVLFEGYVEKLAQYADISQESLEHCTGEFRAQGFGFEFESSRNMLTFHRRV
jgi:hypothetical protein